MCDAFLVRATHRGQVHGHQSHHVVVKHLLEKEEENVKGRNSEGKLHFKDLLSLEFQQLHGVPMILRSNTNRNYATQLEGDTSGCSQGFVDM